MERKREGIDPNLVVGDDLIDVGIQRVYYQKVFPSTSLDDTTQPIIFQVFHCIIITTIVTSVITTTSIELYYSH